MDGDLDWSQSARDNDRASRKIGLKSRRRSFFLQASTAPVYKGAAIPVALHAIKS